MDFSKTLSNAQEAEKFLSDLVRNDMAFHLDDHPGTIFNGRTGERLFTDEQAVLMVDRVAEVFQHLEDPFDTLLNLLKEFDEQAVAPGPKTFAVGSTAWTYVLNDEDNYVPRQVKVIYGPDANNMYVVLKENGVTDRTGVLRATEEEIAAYLCETESPVDDEPELNGKPRPF